MRAVGHSHRVRSGADAGDRDRVAAEPLGALLVRQDTDRRPVRHRADVQHRQRIGHHRGGAHLPDREALRLLGERVVEGVPVVLHRDQGHLFRRGSEFVHMSSDHHRVIPGVEAADREVEIGVGGQGDELVALPGVHTGHRLETERHADRHPSGGDRLPGRLKTEPSRRAAALDPLRGLWAEPQVVLDHAGGLELARKMIREIRADRPVDRIRRKRRRIGQRHVVRLLHHQPEVFILIPFLKRRNPAGDHVDPAVTSGGRHGVEPPSGRRR